MEKKKRIKSPYSGVFPKRSKSKKSIKKKKAEPFLSKYPSIDYEKIKIIPEITVIIKFDQARSDFNAIELKIPSNKLIKNVVDKIYEKHCHSCHNVKIFVLESSQKKYLNDVMFKTFEELKISLSDNFNVFYEYEPVENPILEAGLV
jgi:hypothetical protein